MKLLTNLFLPNLYSKSIARWVSFSNTQLCYANSQLRVTIKITNNNIFDTYIIFEVLKRDLHIII